MIKDKTLFIYSKSKHSAKENSQMIRFHFLSVQKDDRCPNKSFLISKSNERNYCLTHYTRQCKSKQKAERIYYSLKNSLKLSYSPFLSSNSVIYFLQIVSSSLLQIVSFYCNILINFIKFSDPVFVLLIWMIA